MYNRKLEIALINGGGSGMGRAIAQRLSHESFQIYVSDTRPGPKRRPIQSIRPAVRQKALPWTLPTAVRLQLCSIS
jgi:NAD(P)-dependent dehydrogenase (short-subunit alcohol dehydrogenase family)